MSSGQDERRKRRKLDVGMKLMNEDTRGSQEEEREMVTEREEEKSGMICVVVLKKDEERRMNPRTRLSHTPTFNLQEPQPSLIPLSSLSHPSLIPLSSLSLLFLSDSVLH